MLLAPGTSILDRIRGKERIEGDALIERVRSELNSKDPVDLLARRAGIYRRRYSLLRKLLMLSSAELPEVDAEKIKFGINALKNGIGLQQLEGMMAETLSRHWAARTRHGFQKARVSGRSGGHEARNRTVKAKKATRRIENTVFAIHESCCNNYELEIPKGMSPSEIKSHQEKIIESIEHLFDLYRKLKGATK